MMAAVVLSGCPSDDAPADALDGDWSASWTCTYGCEHTAPTIAAADIVEVAGPIVVWVGTTYGEIERVGKRDDACIAMPFDDEQTLARQREPFDLCAVDGILTATVQEHASGGAIQVEWHLTATR